MKKPGHATKEKRKLVMHAQYSTVMCASLRRRLWVPQKKDVKDPASKQLSLTSYSTSRSSLFDMTDGMFSFHNL